MSQQRRWQAFTEINRHRRAVRDFGKQPVSDMAIESALREAILAPSSGNIQPYEFHWVRDATLRENLAKACNGQGAAQSATALIVVVASKEIARGSLRAQAQYIEQSTGMTEESKSYHRAAGRKLERFFRFGAWSVWSPVHLIVAVAAPSLSLIPIGRLSFNHWVARNSIFAAQNLMIALAAQGLDSCPMEGFQAVQIVKTLKLPRGSVIPVVIAIGKRSDDALIGPQWRRSFHDVVNIHS
jgi:nitroreductase